jgi:hypothetical protein
MADFGQEPSLMLVVPSAIPQPCVGLVHVGRKYQDWLVRLRHTVQAFDPFHRQAFLAWRMRPSRVQFTDQGLMVSERSGRLQLTHSLRMCSCQRLKSVGVVFMGLGLIEKGYRININNFNFSSCIIFHYSKSLSKNAIFLRVFWVAFFLTFLCPSVKQIQFILFFFIIHIMYVAFSQFFFWCGFHGVGVWLVRLKADDSGWFVSVWADGLIIHYMR